MKKRAVIAVTLLILLTTITTQNLISLKKFNLQEINIENNFLIDQVDIKNSLAPIYQKNLILLKNSEIEKILLQNSFIDSFIIKKKYPNTLKIKIFEKKPIAILIKKKKKFYLSERIELIEFYDLKNFKELPLVFGNEKQFKFFYEDLKKINFPIELIKKYSLYESKRWDLETIDKKLIKLSVKNYKENLNNYLNIKNKSEFKNYTMFDYRIKNQLILK